MDTKDKIPPLKFKPNPITLYHGSPYIINQFVVSQYARSRTDYGLGVYFTTNREQAKKWSVRGNGTKHGYVYEVHLDYRLIQNGQISLKEFLDYSDEFIDTFTVCRTYGISPDNIKNVDVVYGVMIDSNKDRINQICEDYALGKIDRVTVRRNLKLLKESDQVCIKNNTLLQALKIHRVDETYVLSGRSKNEERNILWRK